MSQGKSAFRADDHQACPSLSLQSAEFCLWGDGHQLCHLHGGLLCVHDPGTAMYTIGTAGLADAENRMLYIGVALAIAVVVVLPDHFKEKVYTGGAG